MHTPRMKLGVKYSRIAQAKLDEVPDALRLNIENTIRNAAEEGNRSCVYELSRPNLKYVQAVIKWLEDEACTASRINERYSATPGASILIKF